MEEQKKIGRAYISFRSGLITRSQDDTGIRIHESVMGTKDPHIPLPHMYNIVYSNVLTCHTF